MGDGIAILVVVVAAAIFAVGTSRAERSFRILGWCGFWAHVAAGIAQVVITRDYYGYGDMLAYHRSGLLLARGLDRAPLEFGFELLKMFLHQPNGIIGVHGNGWSTGSLHAVSAVWVFLLDGSLMGICVSMALLSFVGKVLLWDGLRRIFPPTLKWPLFAGSVLVPSLVFWTSGLLKEAIAVIGLGALTNGAVRVVLRRERAAVPSVLMLVGAVLVGATKAYILFAFALAVAAAWFVARRRAGGRGISIYRALLAVGIAVVGVMALGALFPRYSTSNLADEVVALQEVGQTHAGGSTIRYGSGLTRIPAGFATALFRPFLFEVRNPLMLVSSMEVTVYSIGILLLIRRFGARRVAMLTVRHEGIAFCVVFTIVFAAAVGAASSNLGTLSRYRVPMLPFFAGAVLALVAHGWKNERAIAVRRRMSH